MKLQKNKLVAVMIVGCVVLFIVLYSILTLGKAKEPELKGTQLPVPKLGEGKKQYETKLEALEDLKEEREVNAPSPYDERLLDSTGRYEPGLLDQKKRRLIDSIYAQGRIDYGERSYREPEGKESEAHQRIQEDVVPLKIEREPVVPLELGLEHQLFFASDPKEDPGALEGARSSSFLVRVDGNQTVRKDHRLRMRLMEGAIIGGWQVPRNTVIYGFVSFKPNRVLLHIATIAGISVDYTAHDLGDGSEGIYIENSFREETRREVAGDALGEINIGGVPQLRGIKKLFQRDNRLVKVTVMDDHQLMLKVPKGQ